MSSFRVIEHRVPAAHLREFPRATSHSEEDVLHLAVKQYIPLNNPRPKPGDVTILAAHANAFPKELYEPLWEELLARAESNGWRIRGIWMADVAWQGESGVLNETLLGNDPNWDDHPRDLMNLINLKREDMPRPIVGLGHSMGGAHLAKVALFHPSLFTSLILLDPVILAQSAESSGDSSKPNMAKMSSFRRPTWPSREAAKAAFLKSPFYRAWDTRCFDRWVEHGLRDCPNHTFPDVPSPQVSLATNVAQEVWTFLRPNYRGYGVDGKPINRVTHPDIDTEQPVFAPLYRVEPFRIRKSLPSLRPSCLFIFGGTSPVGSTKENDDRVNVTGTGAGGSGGLAEKRVKGLTFDGVGHLIPMEAPGKTAEAVSEWIGAETQLHRQRQEFWQREWWSKSLREKQQLDEKWINAMGGPPKKRKPTGSKM